MHSASPTDQVTSRRFHDVPTTAYCPRRHSKTSVSPIPGTTIA
jgi:hypothetical protein